MQHPALLISKNTNRKERPEVAQLMLMTGCYLLSHKTSWVWIGVLGCSGLVMSSGNITEGFERQTLRKKTLRVLSLHSFSFAAQKTLNSHHVCKCSMVLYYQDYIVVPKYHDQNATFEGAK